jgi:hypothetical protein
VETMLFGSVRTSVCAVLRCCGLHLIGCICNWQSLSLPCLSALLNS